MKSKQKKKQSFDLPVPSPASDMVVVQPPAVVPLLIATVLIVLLAAVSLARNAAYESPVTLWADASSKSMNKRRTHENYGQALSTAGKLAEALKQFETVRALPDDGSVPMRDLYREIGVVYFRMGRIEDSITAWQTGLRFAPGDPSLLNNLSVALIKQGQYDEAERVIRAALAAAPSMPYALNSLGEILMAKGNYQEALQCFVKAIQVSPETPARYWNAALAADKAGRPDIALQYVNQFLAIEPDPVQRQRGAMLLAKLRADTTGGRKRE